MMRALGIMALAVALLGCPSKDSGKLKVDITAEHVAAVNALVPPEWKDKIVFEAGVIKDKSGRTTETYRLAVPGGWKPRPGPIAGVIVPADADDFNRSATLDGAIATMRASSDCGGECTAKDWAVVVDDRYYKKFTTATTGKVTKDDKTETGRTMVFERAADAGSVDGEINILTTWWKKGGSQHYICEAQLAGAAVALAPAFEKACSLVSAE